MLGSRIYAAAWEARRRAYAMGLARPRAVGTGVVSVGNLSVGGTGKTTLTLHLARLALARGIDAAVVCRRYRAPRGGAGDEELLYVAAVGADRVHAGAHKASLAADAAARGRRLVLVDDGFSHWALARDLDLVLIDASVGPMDESLLPAGRLREPWRALQRAEIVVLSRVEDGIDAGPVIARLERRAPAAWIAAGRHRVARVRRWDGTSVIERGPARVVTGTGNPSAVARSAEAAGFDVIATAAYRDHHRFRADEARRELERARTSRAVLVITAKDAVRWPAAFVDERVVVLEVEWEWVEGGEEVERRVLAVAAHSKVEVGA